jgi:hypothetical protein
MLLRSYISGASPLPLNLSGRASPDQRRQVPTDVRPRRTPLMVTSGAAHGPPTTPKQTDGVRPDIVDQRVREMPCGLVPQRWGCLLGERDTNILERIAVWGEDPDDDRADRDR